MIKLVFIGAGGVVFYRKNMIVDCMTCDCLRTAEYVLYDINPASLKESEEIVRMYNRTVNNNAAKITVYCGVEQRKKALESADFVINGLQVGGNSTMDRIDFEIPKKYGLRQTIADPLGIGGIFRGLRTLPLMKEIADEMEEVCPNAWLLNYTNPLAMVMGYLLRFTNIKAVGLCDSAKYCASNLLSELDMEVDGYTDKIAGINHMAWLLEIRDLSGKDLYPEIKERAAEKNKHKHNDMIRLDYIRNFGYYCTESSEHNAEYSMFYIKSKYPELIEQFNIPLDEHIAKHKRQADAWNAQKMELLSGANFSYERKSDTTSKIIEAIVTNVPCRITGDVLNNGLIANLPPKACVEVPCLVDGNGVQPIQVVELPPQLAALNMTNINVQLLTIEAVATHNREHIYQAAMMDPHTASELSIDDIRSMCDELRSVHHEIGF